MGVSGLDGLSVYSQHPPDKSGHQAFMVSCDFVCEPCFLISGRLRPDRVLSVLLGHVCGY